MFSLMQRWLIFLSKDKKIIFAVVFARNIEGVRTPSSSHFQVILLPSPACLPKSKCKHACKQNFEEQKVMVYDGLEARRTPSTSPPRNYVYKHVYIYFSAAGQVMAVGSLESGNLMVYGPLQWCLAALHLESQLLPTLDIRFEILSRPPVATLTCRLLCRHQASCRT